MEKKVQEKKLKIEISQSKRENDFIIKNYEKSKKYLNKKRELKADDNGDKNKENKKEKIFDKKDFMKYKQKKIIK